MNTAEAWFAVIGFVSLPLWLYLAGAYAYARITGRMSGAGPEPEPEPAQSPGEYPERRRHEAGGCWCGELHEGTPANDGEPAWRAS